MPGIFGIVSNHCEISDMEIEYQSLSTLDCKKKILENLRFERFTNQKFLDDKIFDEDDDLLIGIEGVIFNYSELREKYFSETNFLLIKTMYKSNEIEFFNDFRGEFSGFVYDKKKHIITVFTNHTASKTIFYYFDEESFIFSSEVKIITQILHKLGKNNSLNETGAYFILTYGYMLHDHTLVNNVKKLLPGHYIRIDLSNEANKKISFKHEVNQYFRFSNEYETKDSKTEIINKIDELFKHSVTQEYNKDLEYGYKHIATLSGGLDSRMSVMMADKLGFKNITTMTFSESDYWDERIAKQIAHDKGFEFLFMSLDHGNFFRDIDSAIIGNDGNFLYAGAAHHLRMTSLINHQNIGLQHTGMLGDAIFGTYLKKSKEVQVNIGEGAYSQGLIPRIEAEFNEIVTNYPNSEIFKLYNRGFNGMFNGYWMTQQFTEFSSAFLNVDMLNYALSIPAKFKHNEQIYIDWIRSKHRDIGKYRWESTLTSVNMWLPIYKIAAFSRRVVRSLKRRLHLSRLYSMNPVDDWYRKNIELRKFIETKFNDNISNLNDYKELQHDCISKFKAGNTIQKTQVLTLLRAFDLLNLS